MVIKDRAAKQQNFGKKQALATAALARKAANMTIMDARGIMDVVSVVGIRFDLGSAP